MTAFLFHLSHPSLLHSPITLEQTASLHCSFAVSTSGFHSVPPVPLSFHLIPKSPNSTHYSLNWWALTPASGPIELVVISRQDLWRSRAGGSGPKLSDTHTHAVSQSAWRACGVSLQLNTYQPPSVKQRPCQKLDGSQVCLVRRGKTTQRSVVLRDVSCSLCAWLMWAEHPLEWWLLGSLWGNRGH